MPWKILEWLNPSRQANTLAPQPEAATPPLTTGVKPAEQAKSEINPETKATAATIIRLLQKDDPRALSWLIQMGIDPSTTPNLEQQIAEKLGKNKSLRREVNSTMAKNGDQEKPQKAVRTRITEKPLSETAVTQNAEFKAVGVTFGDNVLVLGDAGSQQALADYVFGIIKDKDAARGIAKKITHLSKHPNEIKAFMTQFVHEHALPPGAHTKIEYGKYRVFLSFEYADGGAISAIEILSSSGKRGNIYSKTKSRNGARG